MALVIPHQFLLVCSVATLTILWQYTPTESLLLQAYTERVDTSDPPMAPPGPTTNSSWYKLHVIQEAPNGTVTQEGTSTETGFASLSANWSSCGTGNPIDGCWRCDKDWESHRQALASCAMGFGRAAIGGRDGQIYSVTSNDDDNVAEPQPGNLRHAATREEPLWITFARSMTIFLHQELILTSFKTIDGRGVDVHIAGGAGLTLCMQKPPA